MQTPLLSTLTLVGMLACAPEEAPTPHPASVDEEAGVACHLAVENLLRWTCTVTVPSPQAVVLTVTPTDGSPERTLESPDAVGVHIFPVWYQSLSDEAGSILNNRVSEEGTLLVNLHREAYPNDGLRVIDWAGTVLFAVDRSEDYTWAIHHDMFAHEGLYYALFREQVDLERGKFGIDGFYIFDAEGALLAEWRLIDHHTPPEGPALAKPVDYSHANSIEVTADHQVLISFRHLSTVLLVEGDLGAPNFGEIVWSLAGREQYQPLGSDYVITASAGEYVGFEQQHNAHLQRDDRLVLFDNRYHGEELSRVLEIDLDAEGRRADITNTYALGSHCHYQGGQFYTSSGTLIATCAPKARALEFDVGDHENTKWDFTTACAGDEKSLVPRFIPIETLPQIHL